MRIWSGSFGTTLVVAHSKGSEGSPFLITNAMFDPIYQRPIGLDAISSAGLQAKAYMDEKGARPEHWALVSVKNHGNSFKNPFAHLPLNLTVEEVLNSRLLSDPLRLLDCSPVSDGACAIVLASEERAGEAAKDPVWIKGFGYAADLHYLGDRNLADPIALRKAAKNAYEMAGVSAPRDEIDFVELYDAFSYMEPLWLEGMGFSEPGKGGMLIEKGITGLDGSLPVNASGGVLSTHPVLTAGLVRIAEAVLQIRGTANEHQVDKNRVGLAHGINGPCGQSHCVIVLSKE
jgi:acetyl-CoA C-acetyltransferase